MKVQTDSETIHYRRMLEDYQTRHRSFYAKSATSDCGCDVLFLINREKGKAIFGLKLAKGYMMGRRVPAITLNNHC